MRSLCLTARKERKSSDGRTNFLDNSEIRFPLLGSEHEGAFYFKPSTKYKSERIR